nr:ankyrin-3 [Quercus suber]
MDPFSGAASVLTLLDALKAIIDIANTIQTRLRNAPEELSELRQQTHVLTAELLHVESTTREIRDEIASPQIQVALLSTVLNARDTLCRIDDICLGVRYQDGARDQDLLLTDISSRSSLLVLKRLEALESLRPATLLPSTSAPHSKQSASQPRKSRTRQSGATVKFSESGAILGALGIHFTTLRSSSIDGTDYSILARLKLPLSTILGPYAVLFSGTFRMSPDCFPNLQVVGGASLAVARPLPDHHPFFTACTNGDRLAVRRMLLSGEGRITDYNEAKRSPMAIALWKRQYDIVRMLLDNGASQHHVSCLGWNAVFYCWAEMEKLDRGSRSAGELLDLLDRDAFVELDTVDTNGWSCLHLVAAYETAAEVNKLIYLGADHLQVALPLRWTAIHHAVYYGNFATYETLVPHYHDLLTMTDERGWTLLHIAASAGHRDTSKDLLLRGADPKALSKPFGSHMPETLYHKQWTPREVAAAQGSDREQQYLEILDELGIDPFFDAEEKLFLLDRLRALPRRVKRRSAIAYVPCRRLSLSATTHLRDIG